MHILLILMVLLVGSLLAWQLIRKTRCINTSFIAPPAEVGSRVFMRRTRRGWTTSGILAFLGYRIAPRGEILRMANTTPPPYSTGTHKAGRMTAFADAAITVRYSLIAIGVSEGSIKSFVTGTAEFPLGIIDDTTDTLNSDLTIPVHYDLIGSATDKTLRVATRTNVAYGDWLIADTTDGRYAMTDPATASQKVFRIGRALHSAVANDPAGVEIAVLPQIVQH